MNKSDYDKYYKKGGTYVIPVEVFNELFDELERLSSNYEQALEDLDKKDNIVNELEKYLIEEIEDYDKDIKSQYITDIAREQYEGEKVCFEDMLYKIKELKGSDKE